MRPSSKVGFGLVAVTAALFAVSGNACAQDAAVGEKVFKRYCTLCHNLPTMDQSRIGPSLKGTVGRKAASYPGFAYSSVLSASGITWTEDQLETWLSGPQTMVPGTKMTFAGVKDAAERANLIAYLKSNP